MAAGGVIDSAGQAIAAAAAIAAVALDKTIIHGRIVDP